MSESIQQSIDRKRQEAIQTGIPLINLLTSAEAAFLKEARRQIINAQMREHYARNRDKEIADQICKQRTPEGKAAKVFFNALARARRWRDNELETALLEEKSLKGKAALVDVPAIMRRLGRGNKWRIKPPEQPKLDRRLKFSRLTRETIFERTKGGDTALHRAIKSGKLAVIPQEAFSLEIFLAQNDSGRTPLHYAAHFGCLSQIPREYLTQQTLSIKNRYYGSTPVHIAAEDGHLDQIPPELLTQKLMEMPNIGLATPQFIVDWKRQNPGVPVPFRQWRRVGDEWKAVDVTEFDAGDGRWREDAISLRQKAVLLYFGRSIQGLTKGQAADVIDEIYTVPGKKEQWESAKHADISQIKGTKLYAYIRRKAEEDWEDFEGETLDSALWRIEDFEPKWKSELNEIERWLNSEDARR